MRAVSAHRGSLEVVELPDPRPGRGQVVLDVARCGICGSDLHARNHADGLAEVMSELDYRDFMQLETPVVMGHEFCGEVLEAGPGVGRDLKVGTLAVAMPLVRGVNGVHPVGLSPLAPGGYAEQVLVQGSVAFGVPNGLAAPMAALTEPMAVALHAVLRGEVTRRDTTIVLGCGPVGLAVICHLRARGVRTIVASDPSAGRRALASRCGADVVLDPTENSPYEAPEGPEGDGFLRTAPDLLDLAVDSMDRLRRLPGWSHLYRAADVLGVTDLKRPVIFECVGVPGMIEGIVSAAPLASRVVVVGVCMGQDSLRPSMAINKELDLRFVLGYTPLEFRDTLHLLAQGEVDASPLLTGTVGLDGVAAAFDVLAGAGSHAKVLVDPRSEVTFPPAPPEPTEAASQTAG